MTEALLIGCPPSLVASVRAQVGHADILEGELGSALAPVVVIGTEVEHPLRAAQRVFKADARAAVLIASTIDRFPEIEARLMTAPYVGVGTRVIRASPPEVLAAAVAEALSAARASGRHRTALSAASSRLTQPGALRMDEELAHLRLRNRLLTSVVDSSYDAILTKTLKGVVTSWNAAATRLYGYTEAEMVGENIETIVPAHRRAELRGIHLAIAAGESVDAFETVRITKEGRLVDVSLTISPVFDDRRRIVGASAIARDIGAMKAAERALVAAEAKYRDLYDNAPDMFVTVDVASGLVAECNAATARAVGLPVAEVVGSPVLDLYDPSSRVTARRALEALKATGRVESAQLALRTARGETIPVLLSATAIYDNSGNVVRTRSVLKDVSHLHSVLEELRRSNLALEQFAYVASHDLQEPLRMVASYTKLLEDRYGDALDDRARKYIHNAADGATRMRTLIDDLLAYSRVGVGGAAPERVDTEEVVAETLSNLSTAMEESEAEIVVGRLPAVRGDRSQMVQLFQNILSNALKFRSEAAPRVSIDATRQGVLVEFRVTDNGMGFGEDVAGRVFGLFQRGHPREMYPGTGLGLAIARAIVERHGGTIRVESAPNRGSTFIFTLRAADD